MDKVSTKAGGWLVANMGYSGTFTLAVTFALLGLAASVQLREARVLGKLKVTR